MAADCRVWTYDLPAVVLGCSQRLLRDGVQQRLEGRAEVLERESGGGAVLAGPWLVSASVVLPHAHPWACDGLIDSYRRLAQLHVVALSEIGVAARALAPRDLPRANESNAIRGVDWACFGGLSPWEVVDAQGRKLVGLAQRRRQTGVLLVAGTLIGAADWSLLCDAMGHPQDESMLRRRTISAEEVADGEIDAGRFASVLMRSLKRCISSGTIRCEPVDTIRAKSARSAPDFMTTHVLILCTHNSARSVLAEGMLNHWAARLARDVKAHSAGSAPSGRINPLAIEALQRVGIDTTGYRSKSWDGFSVDGAPPLSIVITVCDSAAAEACPVFFGGNGGQPVKVHWGYPDPSNAEGGDEGKRRAFELTRQAIGYRMLQLLALPLETLDRAALQAALDGIGRS